MATPTPEEATAAYTAATTAFGANSTFANLNDMCTKGINKLTVNITKAISTNNKDNLLTEIGNVKAVFDQLIESTELTEAMPEYKSKIADLYKTLKAGAESLATLIESTDTTKAELKIEDPDSVKTIKSAIDYLKAVKFTAEKDDKSPPTAAAAGAAAVSGTELAKYKTLLQNLTANEEIVTTLANAVATSIQKLDKDKDKPAGAAAAAGGTQRVGTKKRKRRKRRGKGTGKNKPLSEVNVVL
jgi:hypothetical protein